METSFTYSCGNSFYYTIYLVLTIAYKFLLHTVGLVLAFLTRNIQIDVLNDYHYNTIIIIISSIMLLAIFPQIILVEYPFVLEVIWGLIIFIATSSYLGLTFVPKVRKI